MSTITRTGTPRGAGGTENVDDLAVRPSGRSITRGRQLGSVEGRRSHRGRLANALGWFGVGIGVAQIVAPGAVARLVGVDSSRRNRTLLRALGAREIASGVGVLSTVRPARWMWARTAGDAMDLSFLGATLTSDDARQKEKTVAATTAVLGVTALDVLSARRLTRGTGATRAEKGERRAIVRKSITVNRPPEEVYAFWRDFENFPRFMRHLESVEVLGEGRSHWKVTAPAGQTMEWDAEIIEDRPNELIAWRSVQRADVSNSGTVRFREAPGGRGTEVTVELQYDPPGGKVGLTLAKLFREEPSQQVSDDLRAFKNVLETGEVVLSDATLHRGMHPAQPAGEPITE